MRTFRAVVKRDRDNGSLVGWFPAFPGSEAHGSNLDEIHDGLRSLALTLASKEPNGGLSDVGVETVSVL